MLTVPLFVQIIARIAIAGIFAYSAYAKARHGNLVSADISHIFGRASGPVVWLVCGAEIVAAAVAIASPSDALARISGVALVVTLSGYYGVSLATRDDPQCSCIGIKSNQGEDQPLLSKVGTVVGHSFGNSLLAGCWWLGLSQDGTLSTKAVFLAAGMPTLVTILGLLASISRARFQSRREFHPLARSMTVQTVRLGRCVRFNGGNSYKGSPNNAVERGARRDIPLTEASH